MLLMRRTLSILILTTIITVPWYTRAQSATAIQEKIANQQTEIEALEGEIKQYEAQLTEIGKEKQTLEGAVRELDISRRKVSANISIAQKKINATASTISELDADIKNKEDLIGKNQKALAETIRTMNEVETGSFIETMLSADDISTFWSDIDTIQKFQVVVRNEVEVLSEQKKVLEVVKVEKQIQKGELVTQKTQLSTQQRSLDINRDAKNKLLEETENRESTYQELLETKQKAKEEFEAQLRSFEAELQYILDPTSIPPAGKGVFMWPVSNVRITQYFGNTKFAKSGAYNGSGHNGVDMGVPIGTPVMAVLSGNVRATGNTDAYPGCYSYGKWVLIEHVNGLTTLYAHLSDIAVTPGEPVATGQVIAYSGNSGFSTGPHLHLTTYASDAVEVVRLGDVKARTSCADAKVPVSSWSGYLNPIDYLP
tara:strand:+ start:23417 stop:24697 length:1281 start_codon:yes stop_codon:yes gene_type:complete